MPQRRSVLHGIGIGDQDGCQARVFCNPTRPKSEPKSATFRGCDSFPMPKELLSPPSPRPRPKPNRIFMLYLYLYKHCSAVLGFQLVTSSNQGTYHLILNDMSPGWDRVRAAAMDLFQVSRPAHSHLSSPSIPIGSGQTPSTRMATSISAATPHRSAEIWAIWQPGSFLIKWIYAAMDLFQVSRPTHSHLSSLSIPICSGQTPSTRMATSTSAAAPHRLAEIWAIWQLCSFLIKRIYAAMDLFQVSRPAHSHLSFIFISICSGQTPSARMTISTSAATPHRSD